MIVFIILNTLCNIYLLIKVNPFDISITYKRTFWNETLLGIQFWKGCNDILYIPIRNERIEELKEEIQNLKRQNIQGQKQSLRAIYSWLKTDKEKEQFKKDYSIVNEEYVNFLINN